MRKNKFIALALAVIMLMALVSCTKTGDSSAVTTADENTTAAEQQNPVKEEKEKTYAADTLLTDGKLGNSDSGELTVGFIGGSLTSINAGMCYFNEVGTQVSAGNSWGIQVCHYLEDKFPNKTVKGVNAGIGGTESGYGAFRFEKYVLDYEPDIVFIEYAVNDCGRDKEYHQKYMERMLNMCLDADKVPVVVFLYLPYPTDKDSDQYATWKTGMEYKAEVANYYGIGDIDVYDYLYRTYESSEYDNLHDFLAQYYVGSTTFDVHGGYDLYYGAIVEAFEGHPEDYFCKIKTPENALYPVADSTYRMIAPNDERLEYDGEWKFYDRSNIYTYPDESLQRYNIEYPFALDGIIESDADGASVSFTSDAAELCFLKFFCDHGGCADVTVDGELAGTVEINSIYNSMANVTYVSLPNDGKMHDIKVTVRTTENGDRYRFGYIAEIFPVD